MFWVHTFLTWKYIVLLDSLTLVTANRWYQDRPWLTFLHYEKHHYNWTAHVLAIEMCTALLEGNRGRIRVWQGTLWEQVNIIRYNQPKITLSVISDLFVT